MEKRSRGKGKGNRTKLRERRMEGQIWKERGRRREGGIDIRGEGENEQGGMKERGIE